MTNGKDGLNTTTSSNSLLIATPKGLQRVYCPFTVMVITPIHKFTDGEQLKVSQVKSNPDNMLVFVISGKCYLHIYFVVIH